MNQLSFIHYMLEIKEIDDQHWELIEIMNNIKQLEYNTTQDASQFNVILTELHIKVEKHFEYEEYCMERDGYPYLYYHKQDHIKLANIINKLSTHDYSKAQFLTNKYLISKLQIVIIDHIDQSDMQYGEWYRNNVVD